MDEYPTPVSATIPVPEGIPQVEMSGYPVPYYPPVNTTVYVGNLAHGTTSKFI